MAAKLTLSESQAKWVHEKWCEGYSCPQIANMLRIGVFYIEQALRGKTRVSANRDKEGKLSIGDRVTLKKPAYSVDGHYAGGDVVTQSGEVVFISPEGWATLQLDCGYCESFFCKSHGGIL